MLVENKFMQNPIEKDATFMQATNKDTWTTVDTKYADQIKQYPWAVDKNGYFRTSQVVLPDGSIKTNCGLHEYVLALSGKEANEVADHICSAERQINNRESNLRGATQKQNTYNRKVAKNNKLGILGVKLEKDGYYSANIWLDTPEGRYIGRSKNLVAIQLAYNVVKNLYATKDVKDFLALSEVDYKKIDAPTLCEALRILRNYVTNQIGHPGRDNQLLKKLSKQLNS